MAEVEPLRIVLEFARASDAGDPHAFRFAPQSYLVRGERGDFTSTEVAWSRELLADLEALRLPGRDPAALQRVGEVLRRTLEPAGWRQREGAIVDAVAEGRRVSVTIRSAAAELYALPWELLTLRSTGQSLGAIGGVLLRYEWPATATSRARGGPADAEADAGRVLLAWSAAGGAVPAAEHVAALRSAQEGAGRPFDEGRDVLAHATFGRLADLLAEAEASGAAIDGLHILCHGGATGTSFGLTFDGEDGAGAPVVVDPGRLQQLLAPYAGMIRLVVLAACDSGNAGDPGSRLGSVAQMLHRVGVAAVVASRYPLSIGGSNRLSEVLYRGLLTDGATLEEAFVRSRTALARDPTTLDWASVQLYARADDGDATYPLGPPRPGVEDAAAIVAATPAGAPSRLPLVFGGIAALVIAAAVAFALGFGPERGAQVDPGAGAGPAIAGPAATSTIDAGDATTGATTGGAATTGGEATTGDAATTGDGSTTAADAASTGPAEAPPMSTSSTTSSTKVTKKKTATPPANVRVERCPKGLAEYLESKLGSPDGGGVFAIKVNVRGDGSATITSCRGCGELEGAATGRLTTASRDRVLSKGGGGLPCVASFDWD
ncbi:MAG: CHAT domain-containing protein [Nannocystaceae bacterium]